MTGVAPATGTAFDRSERAIWRGSADAYDRSFARLCAHLSPVLLDAALAAGHPFGGASPGADDRTHAHRGSGGRLRVLDVGTGSGTGALAAAARGARVVAADAEPDMVRLALDRAAARGLGGVVTGVVAALPELPFADGEFDAVTAGFVLNHVGRPRAAAAELARVVRPGGRVAVTIWASPPAAGQTLVGRALAAAGIRRPAALPSLDPADDFERTPDGLGAVLRDAGLVDVVVERRDWTHRVDADTWWSGPASGVATVGAVLTGAPAQARARARACYDELAVTLTGPDGLLELPHAALLGRGRRPAPV